MKDKKKDMNVEELWVKSTAVYIEMFRSGNASLEAFHLSKAGDFESFTKLLSEDLKTIMKTQASIR